MHERQQPVMLWGVGPGMVTLMLVAVLLMGAGPSHAQGSVESEVFSKINANRSSPLARHSGLADQARAHSKTMAAQGGLSHTGSSSRPTRAAPDPAESNGAPDDGYNGTFCENVAYVSIVGGPAAQRIYAGWENSNTHRSCMRDGRMTAGAVGIYNDGDTLWATFIAMLDSTAPGSAPPPPPEPTEPPEPPAPPSTPTRRTPAPTRAPAPANVRPATATAAPTPSATASPTPTPSPSPSPSATPTPRPTSTMREEALVSEPTRRSGFGLREGAALTALLGFSAGGVAVVRFRSRN